MRNLLNERQLRIRVMAYPTVCIVKFRHHFGDVRSVVLVIEVDNFLPRLEVGRTVDGDGRGVGWDRHLEGGREERKEVVMCDEIRMIRQGITPRSERHTEFRPHLHLPRLSLQFYYIILYLQ